MSKGITDTHCPVCEYRKPQIFLEKLDAPIHCSLFWPSPEAARHCPKGDIRLAFCPRCGLITNVAFDTAAVEYTQEYENNLFFSPRFQHYARSLAQRLVERYNLYNKDIVEIGCGKGDFLLLLCELGNNRGVGFDPTYVEQEKHREVKDRVKFIQDLYSERYDSYEGDLIVCRQTLEHIHNPKAFLNTLRRTIGNCLDTSVFFEVPNALHTFRRLSIWDIIYEHRTYFTPVSLALTFLHCTFQVCEVTEEFRGQYLCIHALPNKVEPSRVELSRAQEDEIDQIACDIASFAENYQKKVEMCKQRLERIESRGQRTVVWGSGARGVSFLNVIKDQQQIEYAVDINPYKQGMYIPGTGQRIVPPEFLREYQPDVIIVMNPVYRKEIRELTRKLGVTSKLVCV